MWSSSSLTRVVSASPHLLSRVPPSWASASRADLPGCWWLWWMPRTRSPPTRYLTPTAAYSSAAAAPRLIQLAEQAWSTGDHWGNRVHRCIFQLIKWHRTLAAGDLCSLWPVLRFLNKATSYTFLILKVKFLWSLECATEKNLVF